MSDMADPKDSPADTGGDAQVEPSKKDQQLSRRPVPPTSSFDFTEGAFEVARNTRLLNMCLAITLVVVALFISAVGLRSGLTSSGGDDEIASTTRQIAAARVQLNQAITGTIGESPSSALTRTVMAERATQRANGLRAVAASDVDAAAVVTGAADASASVGATLTVFTFAPQSSPLPDDPAAAAAAGDPNAAAPTPAKAGEPVVVHIEATTTDAATLGAWQAAITALPWMKDPKFNFTPGSPNTMKVDGVIQDALTPKAQALLQQFPPPTTTPPPAQPAPTTTGGG
jgi:hypothetical protein